MTELQEARSVRSLVAAMPKAELHLHLDGALRLDTIADLARQDGVSLPVPAERLSEVCIAPEKCDDLMHVLSFFATPISVLQTAEALERVTYEVCEDVARENVRYVEIRFAPSLHLQRGLTIEQVIAAVVRGWERGRREFGLRGGILLCALRHLPPAENLDMACHGVRWLGNGVVGYDLAGDEAGFPVLLQREPLLWAKEAGFGMTVHAGEAAGAQSVREAVEQIGASRIGHGVRSGEDPSLLPVLRTRAVTLEMCPTSNYQTHAVPGLTDHPLARYYRAGVRVTVNTDNRTVADTTMTRELERSHEALSLSIDDLARMTLTAVDAGFSDPAERRALHDQMASEMRDLGIEVSP